MTQANELITPTIMRQTGDQESRIATPKDLQEGRYLIDHPGLTKREYFANTAKVDTGGYSASFVESIIGKPQPKESNVALLLWFAEFEATLKVIAADALIAALNK